MKKLYGDGIHDDTEAIQNLIDSGVRELILPNPAKFYLISKPLELPSNFRLVLPRFAEIKLADQSNCVMLKNKTEDKPGFCLDKTICAYVGRYSPDFVCENIEVCGGIWNCNNRGQNPNPIQTNVYEPAGYSGFGMLFFSVRHLTLRALTVKDPVNFGVTLDRVSYFTVEDIVFDYNYGNPKAVNMDGIHINGNCHYGIVKNLKGACYDDMVALNADEGSDGDITNIEISGIWAENSHSAVRLLTVKNAVENIHIHDVFGTYYQYCIGITKYYEGKTTGRYAGISIDNIFASKAPRLSVYCKEGTYVFPLIWIESYLNIRDISISNVCRKEMATPVETVYFGENSFAENFSISHIFTENNTKGVMPLFRNNGTIRNLFVGPLDSGRDIDILNNGNIENQVYFK